MATGNTSAVPNLLAEVAAARDGEANLLAKINAIDSAVASAASAASSAQTSADGAQTDAAQALTENDTQDTAIALLQSYFTPASKTSNYTLLSSDNHKLIKFNFASNLSFDLTLSDLSTFDCEILLEPSSLGVLDLKGFTSLTGTTRLHPGDKVKLIHTGSNAWTMEGGSVQAPSQNRLFDPTFKYITLNEDWPDWDGNSRVRWLNGSFLSKSGSVVTMTTTQSNRGGGRRVWLDEIGLAVGDIFTAGCEVTCPSGENNRVTIIFRDASANSLGSANSPTEAGTGAKQQHFVSGTIPANCVAVDVYSERILAGSLTLHSYFVSGRKIQQGNSFAPSFDLSFLREALVPKPKLVHEETIAYNQFSKLIYISAATLANPSAITIEIRSDATTPLDTAIRVVLSAYDAGSGDFKFYDEDPVLVPAGSTSRRLLFHPTADTQTVLETDTVKVAELAF